MVVTMYRYRAV